MAVSLSVGVEVIGALTESTRGIAGLAQRLESAGVSYWVIGAGRGEAPDTRPLSLDPSLVATVAARHSSSLGLVVAAAAHRDHPYNLARRLVSVDHAARGRVGWLALDYDHSIALNAATDTWTGGALDAAHTTDAVAAVRALWRSWPLDSVLGDPDAGVFADVTRIRRADVRNSYQIAGPLNVPGSVQGDLPVWRHRAPGQDIEPGGADLVVVADGVPIPSGSATVVRLDPGVPVATALERIARSPAVGVLLRVTAEQLEHGVGPLLSRAQSRGLVTRPGPGTLRERLGLPALSLPDLSDNPIAFDVVPTPGGRL